MGKLLLVLLSIVSLYSSDVISPSWFNQNNIEKYVFSYGNTIKKAKYNSSLELSNDLNTTVSVNDFVIEKQELFENKYFIKSKYINQTLLNQVKNEIKKLAFKNEELQNEYLKNTYFFKDLNNTFGYFPNVELHDNYLYFNNKKFLIKENEYSNFFVLVDDANLSIDVKNNVKENENFFFQIDSNTTNFITMAIYFNNNLSLFFKNKVIESTLIYPNYKVSDGFSLSLNDNQLQEQALLLLSSCKEEKDLKSYKMIYELKSKNKNLTFSDFINEINDCKLTTRVLEVTK